VVVVCTPVSIIAEHIRALVPYGQRAVFTDVGSVKGAICHELSDLARSGRFVGSHPMCGGHQQGLDHADASLYRGATTILTPLADTPPAPVALVERLWQAVGCRTLVLSPEAHDLAVALASHLPHVLAAAAAAGLSPTAAPVAASGFRDTTRVAAGNAGLWSDILLANRRAVLDELRAAITRLRDLEDGLAKRDANAVWGWLERGRAGRQRFDDLRAPTDAATHAPDAGTTEE
jgi:prephenate dehydrogenase